MLAPAMTKLLAKLCHRLWIRTSSNPALLLALSQQPYSDRNGLRVLGFGTTYGQPFHRGNFSSIPRAALDKGTYLGFPDLLNGTRRYRRPTSMSSHLASKISRFLAPVSNSNGTRNLSCGYSLVWIDANKQHSQLACCVAQTVGQRTRKPCIEVPC